MLGAASPSWDSGSRARESFDSLVSQGRVMVSAAEKRMSNNRMWKERAMDRWLNILNYELLCSRDFRSILEAWARYLPRLGIASGNIVLENGQKERHSFLGSFETPPEGGEATVRVSGPGKAGFSTFRSPRWTTSPWTSPSSTLVPSPPASGAPRPRGSGVDVQGSCGSRSPRPGCRRALVSGDGQARRGGQLPRSLALVEECPGSRSREERL